MTSLVRPDGAEISYCYDCNSNPGSGNLTEVDRPGNNAASSLPEVYATNAAGQVTSVSSPRWVLSARANGGVAGTQGDVAFFSYSGQKVATESDTGVVNFTPSDGTNTLLQPQAPSGTQTWHWEQFTYGSPNGSATTWNDSDHHATSWYFDQADRVTQTSDWTGALWLVSSGAWDSMNDLVATIDPRGNETDMQYDQYGNVITVAKPQITTNVGTFRPTSRFAYDGYNNVVRACDAVWDNQNGGNWGGGNPCSTGATGVTEVGYTYPSYEQYGELASVTGPPTASAPNGYTKTISYNPSSQAGLDYGLPTSVTSASYTQVDGSTVTPVQLFIYDGYGNLTCYSKYTDANGPHYWVIAYDALNRQSAVADPDDASLTSPLCQKSPGISGSHIVTTSTYFSDGSKQTTQSPSEYAAGVSASYAYDADGNVVTSTDYKGGSPAVTTNFYDGADRLVQTNAPNVTGPAPYFYVRDLYDLSEGSYQSIGGQTFPAYGNKYAREEYVLTNSSVQTFAWIATSATAYDALDRSTEEFRPIPAGSRAPQGSGIPAPVGGGVSIGDGDPTLSPFSTLKYDANGLYGLLSSRVNAVKQSESTQYDADDDVTQVTFSDSTPSRAYVYDPDSRVVSATSSALGTTTETYDQAGNVTSEQEASGANITDAAYYSYAYNPDNTRATINVNETGSGAEPFSESFAHRGDGRLTYESLEVNGTPEGYVSKAYTSAGRIWTTANPTASPFQQFSYDNYGRLSGITGAAGTVADGPYDAEGEVLEKSSGSLSVQFSYDGRGQVGNITFTNPPPQPTTLESTTAYDVDGARLIASNAYGPSGSSLDSSTGTTIVQVLPNATPEPPSVQKTGASAEYLQYDASGRQTTQASPYTTTATNGVNCTSQKVLDHGYDAEDHVSSTVSDSSACEIYPAGIQQNNSATYTWGTNGHPATAASSFVRVQNGVTQTNVSCTETAHWDGNMLLFTSGSEANDTTGSAGVLQINLGHDATLMGSTMSYIPRDEAGMSSYIYDPFNFLPSTFTSYPSTYTSYSYVPGSSCTTTPEVREDGYEFGIDVIQGARIYDGTTQAWTTPDAYGGDPSDPVSQQKYVWDGNNPIAYSDPSGFMLSCSCHIATTDELFSDADQQIAAYDASNLGGELFYIVRDAIGDVLRANGNKVPTTEAERKVFYDEVNRVFQNRMAKQAPSVPVKLSINNENPKGAELGATRGTYQVRVYISPPHGSFGWSVRFGASFRNVWQQARMYIQNGAPWIIYGKSLKSQGLPWVPTGTSGRGVSEEEE